jgi:hypothetical protein
MFSFDPLFPPKDEHLEKGKFSFRGKRNKAILER